MVTYTRFQHPQRHLVTWHSNDSRTSNQSDYILVRSRWASSVLDSRAYQGADTSSAHGLDHTLVCVSLHLRLQARSSTKIRSESTSLIWSYARENSSGWNFTIGSLSSNQNLNGRLSNMPLLKRHTPILVLSVADIGTRSPRRAFGWWRGRGQRNWRELRTFAIYGAVQLALSALTETSTGNVKREI